MQLVPLFILQVVSAFHVCMYSDYNLAVCLHLESFWASTKQILDKAVFHFIGMKEYHIKGMDRSFANLGFSVAVIDSESTSLSLAWPMWNQQHFILPSGKKALY